MFSPDGETLAITQSDGNDLKLVGVFSGKEIAISTDQNNPSIRFNRSGNLLITESAYTPAMKLWQVATGLEVKPSGAEEKPSLEITFDPTGETFATYTPIADNQAVQIWDVATARKTKKLILTNFPLYRLHLSPGGQVLAAERNAGDMIKLFDIASGSEIANLASASKPSFSPNGRLLATVNYYGDTIKLWETATGREIAALTNQKNVDGLRFSADGRTLVTWSRDDPLKFWPADLGAWLAAGCRWLKTYLASHPDLNKYSMGQEDGKREGKALCPENHPNAGPMPLK